MAASSSSTQTGDAADVLRQATFSSSSGAYGSDAPLTASDLLGGAFDPARLHPLAGLQDQLEYLTLEDDKTNDLPGASTALPSRGWSDDLCYGTGTTYLSGSYTSPFASRTNGYIISQISPLETNYISLLCILAPPSRVVFFCFD